MATRLLSIYCLVCPLFWGATASVSAEDANDFWSQVVSHATTPVDGHFIVDVARTSDVSTDPKEMRTTMEYWVRGSDVRFDVTDKKGRDVNSQVVLKNGGGTVLNNFDRTSDRVIAAESSKGSNLADTELSSWLHFQALLGRFPFSPLALYEESFHEFSGLGDAGSLESRDIGDSRLLLISLDNGRTITYKFRDSELNPSSIEVTNKSGQLLRRLETEWRPLSSTNTQSVAHTGVLELMSSDGVIDKRYEWNHTLVEDIPPDSNPFTWEALAPAVGKKLVLTDAEGSDTDGGYWDGKEFSDSPFRGSGFLAGGSAFLWLNIVVLSIGVLLLFRKVIAKAKVSKNESS